MSELGDLCTHCGHRYDWHSEHGWCNARRYNGLHCPCYKFEVELEVEEPEDD